jgi:LysR family transcriptional activator of nhaA
MLLPTDHTQVRRSLNSWFDAKRIHPVVAGEFDDTALMFAWGGAGTGIFPVPTIMEKDAAGAKDVQLVGRTRDVRERFYAITLEETPTHPGVLAICQGTHGARHTG